MPDVLNTQSSSVDLGTYVIDPEEVLDNLEVQYARYTSLPLDLARKSDDICIQRHGLTNTQLYNNLKAKMLDNIVDPDKPKIIGVREDFELPFGVEGTDDMDLDASDTETYDMTAKLIAKIEKAKSMQSDTCVIIYPYTDASPYTLEELEELFQRLNYLSFDLQILSDQECIKLFGNDNRYMYETNKAKLLVKENNKEEIHPIEADSYFNGVSSLSKNESVDLLELLRKKLDVVNIKNNGTLYESSLADDGLEDINNAIHLKKSNDEATPEFVPYLIPSEIEQLVGDGSGLSNDERGFLEIYKNSLMNGMRDFDSKGYFNTIKSLYEIKSQNESQAYIINTRMEAYGWNPNLPFNERSFKGARARICNYLNEFYNPTIVDLHTFNEETTTEVEGAVNINDGIAMLVDINGNKYLSFTAYIEDLYSKLERPMISQSIDKDAHVTIYMVLLPPEVKSMIHRTVDSADWRKNNGEAFDIFLSTDNEKVTCAKFLALLAKICKGEVVPGARVYKIFDNEWDQFRVPEISKIIADLKMKKPSIGKILSVYSIGEAVAELHENHSIAYLKHIQCKESEIEANAILAEMKDLVTPQIAVVEAKQVPIRINDKGVVFDLPTMVEEEYQTVHKALLVYDEKEDYEAMKDSLAHLWYLNLLCERKITKWKDNEKKQQQLKIRRDLRARILNDFKKYLKKVVENDPDFDFVVYFKKSRWNDRTIFIDAQTIKYTGRIIAAIVKSLIKKK